MQPTLTTPRLALRQANSSDLDLLWGIWMDGEVRRFLWDDRVITRDEAAATLQDGITLAADGLGLWVLAPRVTAEPSAAEDTFLN